MEHVSQYARVVKCKKAPRGVPCLGSINYRVLVAHHYTCQMAGVSVVGAMCDGLLPLIGHDWIRLQAWALRYCACWVAVR
jgi:hypothetical protein